MRIGQVPGLLPRHGRLDDGTPVIPPDGAGEINRAELSGLIVAEPLRDTGREGDPITVLLLEFGAPDERRRGTSTCCEVEVTDAIADRHRRLLRVGRRVWVAGQLTGEGLWATALRISPPREAVFE